MKKELDTNIHPWVKELIEMEILLYVGMELLKKILAKEQLKYDTQISIDDLEGIRHQEIAIKRGYC